MDCTLSLPLSSAWATGVSLLLDKTQGRIPIMPVISKDVAQRLQTISEIEWNTWTPVDCATLCFVRAGTDMLLIRKKRGLGAGKINAPGGRLDPGEGFEEAAIREVHEEVGLKVSNLEYAGQHFFQFTDGYSMHVQVFQTRSFSGTPIETDEAIPLWISEHAIPYEEMWADDRLWIPHLLKGKVFEGRYVFAGERMVDAVVTV
ncbi:MAG: 8-oxo-dGTP diphosphatase [Myxococcota bacterium]|nr:8-oxo-dGTP diphosphatase [Myxococcota bacterium]